VIVNGEVKHLDALAGGSFIAAGLGVPPGEMATLALKGDARVIAAIREGGTALGVGLATVIDLLNPSRLAVGGGALSLPGYWEAARAAAERHAIPEMFRACALSQVRAGARVAALGAIRLTK
jgi:predicted NBD/HSP70 family sugar kinase